MTRTSRLAAAAAALSFALTLAACSGAEPSTGDSPAATTPATTTTATSSGAEVDTTHNEADTMFAQMMIEHHEGAIEMADLAQQQAESTDVRSLAERISTAQAPEIEQMESWLHAWGEPSTAEEGHGGHGGMEMEGLTQEEAMAELEGLSGTEFDRRFLELMTGHHEGAVEMAEDELESGQNPQAQELAQKIIDDQQAEIAEMEQMLQGL